MASNKKEKSKKRVVQIDSVGAAHIKATFNNIIISMTNSKGQVISWSSAGKMGFRGAKKNTPYAAQVTAADCGEKAHSLGLQSIDVFVKGAGAGREAAIRSLNDINLEIRSINDVTPRAHNGCRPPKVRRP